jgi:anti-sigma regulatory factor (Ser/Thr protein kinase)
MLRLSLDLPEAVAYVTTLRKTCRCLADNLGLSHEDADDIELLLGELATNAVRHAHGDGYRVEVEFTSERALVTVIDRGVGFLPDSQPDPGTTRPDDLGGETHPERFGGWGLPLVRSIADRVEIVPTHPQGTTVRAEKVFR